MCEKLINDFNALKVAIFKELDSYAGKLDYFNLELKSEYQKECINYINETTEETENKKLDCATVADQPPKLTGFIYAIKSFNTNKIYIGSTFQCINRRLRQHITSGSTSSSQVIACGAPYVELIEEYKCTSRKELCRREGYHIQQNKNICVNYSVAGRTLAESQKAYQKKHAEWYKQYIKQWRKDNPDKIKQYYLKKKKI